jgi:hypothetical protein
LTPASAGNKSDLGLETISLNLVSNLVATDSAAPPKLYLICGGNPYDNRSVRVARKYWLILFLPNVAITLTSALAYSSTSAVMMVPVDRGLLSVKNELGWFKVNMYGSRGKKLEY